jgi:hypothetical protein
LLNEDLHAAAVIATQSIQEMAQDGPLPRNEITASIGGKLNRVRFGKTLMKVLKFHLPNLVAFPTRSLVSFSAAYMGVVFEMTKAIQECLQLVLDLPQRHALLSYLAHFNALGKGIFAGKTDKRATLSVHAYMARKLSVFSIPIPPTLVRIHLGVPNLKPVLIAAEFSEIDTMPGVQQKKEIWTKRLELRCDRPYCWSCRELFRNKDQLDEHLIENSQHKTKHAGKLTKNVTNRELVECQMMHLDTSQKEFIRLIWNGYHVLLKAPAGYGKTRTLQCFQETCKSLLGDAAYKNLIAVNAPTNVAAAILNTDTVNAHWGIGVGEEEANGHALYQKFLLSRASRTTASEIVVVVDEFFRFGKIITDFLSEAMLHGCPIGCENAFEVRNPAFFVRLWAWRPYAYSSYTHTYVYRTYHMRRLRKRCVFILRIRILCVYAT